MTELEKKAKEITHRFFIPPPSPEMLKKNYTCPEFHQAQSFIKPYLEYFKTEDHSCVTIIIKGQILYMNWVQGNLATVDEAEFEKNSLEHIKYIKSIPDFLRVMRCFQFANISNDPKAELRFEKKTNLFTITKVTFEGKTKGSKITLEGRILDILQSFFELLGSVTTEQKLNTLQVLSPELHNHFWGIWYNHIGKKSLVTRSPLIRTLQQQIHELKITKAYQFHRFLCKHSTINNGQNITEKEKQLIGSFFLAIGFCQDEDNQLPNYVDSVHFNDVRNWIIRGKYL